MSIKKKTKNKKKTNKCPRPWSWGLGGRLLVQAAKEQHLEHYPGRPQLFPFDRRPKGLLLGLLQKLEGLGWPQELRTLRLVTLEEEDQNLRAIGFQDRSTRSQAS